MGVIIFQESILVTFIFNSRGVNILHETTLIFELLGEDYFYYNFIILLVYYYVNFNINMFSVLSIFYLLLN